MEIAIIIMSILFALFFILSITFDEMPLFLCLIFTVGLWIGGVVMMTCAYNKPTAIDVYRNKTTLEITYRDNIPVDSVVVFKDNEK